jgi:CotH kinase protein
MRNFRFPSSLIVLLFSCVSSIYAQDFYGSGIQEIRIDLPYRNWDVKLDSLKKANPDARLLGSISVNGVKFDSVGVRYKGNSSYFRSRNETSKKLPINVKLDFKNKSNKLKNSYTTIKLSNAFLDPAFIRDPLSYELIRNYMPAPMCNFSKVFLNNKLYGLYINTESIDLNFIQKHYGTTAGHLVKCDPDNWQRVRSQSGCPKGENASLAYLNDSPGCYDAFYEVDDPAAWKDLLMLIKILNKTPDKIETVLNVDQTLWMLALNNAMVNLDSYNGSLSHNYYLWFDSSHVAHPLIWDLNMSFGGWRRNFSFVEMKDDELIQYQPLAEIDNVKRPLISKLLKNPLYRKIYIAHLSTIVNDFLANGALMTRAQAMMKEIDPAVKQDTLKLYTYADFQQAMDKTMHDGPDNVIGLRQLMDKRTQYLQKHPLLNKVRPVIADAKHQVKGESLVFTAKLSNAKAGYVCYRNSKALAFKRLTMSDDGANGDATANDGIYTATLKATDATQYYYAVESEEAALTLPERASFEFFEVK